jgi:hypothetical protein
MTRTKMAFGVILLLSAVAGGCNKGENTTAAAAVLLAGRHVALAGITATVLAATAYMFRTWGVARSSVGK